MTNHIRLLDLALASFEFVRRLKAASPSAQAVFNGLTAAQLWVTAITLASGTLNLPKTLEKDAFDLLDREYPFEETVVEVHVHGVLVAAQQDLLMRLLVRNNEHWELPAETSSDVKRGRTRFAVVFAHDSSSAHALQIRFPPGARFEGFTSIVAQDPAYILARQIRVLHGIIDRVERMQHPGWATIRLLFHSLRFIMDHQTGGGLQAFPFSVELSKRAFAVNFTRSDYMTLAPWAESEIKKLSSAVAGLSQRDGYVPRDMLQALIFFEKRFKDEYEAHDPQRDTSEEVHFPLWPAHVHQAVARAEVTFERRHWTRGPFSLI